MADQLLTVKHAAERLDVAPMTVYRLIYAGLLEPRHIGLGKKKPRVRVAESELDRYIASTGQSNTPKPGTPRPSTPPSSPPRPAGPANPPKSVAA